jgi:alpha-N-arabinofuranosidase
VYHVFDMYRPHIGAKNLPASAHIPELNVPVLGGSARIPAMSLSASRREKTLFVTLTNLSLSDDIRARIGAGAGSVTEARGRVLTHANAQATNTFDHPDEVVPAPFQPLVAGGVVSLTLP